MYTTSAVYKTAIKESSRSFECRVTILDKVYKNDDIVDIIIDGNIQPSDGFMIGATTSQSLDLTLLNKGDMVYGTSTIKVEIGLKIGSKIEYIPMGIYNIDDIEKTDYAVKITAFDNMMKFERNFTTNLGDTLTLQQVVNELARITGVQFTGKLPSYTVKKLEGFSCREVLGYVASICGGNAVITRDGKFTIVTPKDINYSIGASNYFDYKREETKYKISKISCQVGEKVLSKGALGADSMELEFENPWVTDSILQDIYNKLNGFEYLGYSMKWQGDLSLDVGDMVTITDKKGVVRKHPILSQKFTYTGGLTSEIEAKGENKNKNSFSSSGSTSNKIDRIVTELAIVDKALVDVAYIKDLTANNITFGTASGNAMNLQTLLAQHITGENGQFLNITTANTTIQDAVIKDAMIENINAGKINAGIVNTNNVHIQSENGGIVISDNTQQFKDKNGNVRIQMGQDKNRDFNFAVFDETGTGTLIDATGVKEKALADGIIKDRMINEGEIGGEKINISSLITEINKDENVKTIKSSKVQLDTENQTLDIAFKTLKTNVENIQIGGRNLMRYSAPELLEDEDVSNKWSFGRGTLKIGDLPNNDFFNWKKAYRLILTSGQDNCWANLKLKSNDDKFFKLEKDKDYCISFKAYIGQNCKGICVKVFSEGDTTNQTLYEYSKTSTTGIGLDEKITFKANFTGKAYVCIYNIGAINSNNVSSNLLFREIMFEKGNKASDWTPAPEDIADRIQTNTTSISAIQGNIKTLIQDTTIEKDGQTIKLKDEYSKLEQTVGGINTTVGKHTTTMNGLETRVTEAEKKITDKAITSTVSKTFLSKTDASNTYATKSSLTQTSDSIVAKFSSSGGYNIVKNSGFKNGLSGWWKGEYIPNGTNRSISVLKDNDPWVLDGTNALCIRSTNNTSGEFRADSQKFKVKQHTNYTLSYLVAGHRVTSIGHHVRGNEWEIIDSVRYQPKTGGKNRNNWTRITRTFNTGSNHQISVNFFHWESQNNGYSWVTDVMINEGDIALPWTPRHSEIYEGSTTIDANGVTIRNGALKVTNSNGVATIDGSKLMFRLKTWGNGSIVIPNNSQTTVVNIPHNLGFAPVFKGQIGYISNSGETEYYSDSFSLYSTDNGTAIYNVRMFVTNTQLRIVAWRAKNLANSGTKTFYYRYFIEEGVNL